KFESYGNGTDYFVVTLTATDANGCSSSSAQTITVQQGPGAFLSAGSGVDTVTFNNFITFYKCAGAAQPSSLFTFNNAASPATGVTYKILWGDTGVPFTSN